ncbi:TPA: hypothetical protein JHJ70_004831 [Serratia marcescens]|nr:hypothetical protein [Serratia marcescens]
MFDIICTFGGSDKPYSILDFQKLPDNTIELLRYSLVCPDCRKQAYYRKKSVDGKKGLFWFQILYLPGNYSFISTTKGGQECD